MVTGSGDSVPCHRSCIYPDGVVCAKLGSSVLQHPLGFYGAEGRALD